MPTGADLYVQVPDTYSHQDILQWRQEFAGTFNFFEDFDDDFVNRFVFSVADCGLPDIPHQGKYVSAWEVFPKFYFLEIYTMLVYYGPGYERGNIEKLIAVGDWVDSRIPGSTMWYGADGTGVALPFTASVREVFAEYFQLVGWAPYRSKDDTWKEVRHQYNRKIEQAQTDSLSELKRQHGIE